MLDPGESKSIFHTKVGSCRDACFRYQCFWVASRCNGLLLHVEECVVFGSATVFLAAISRTAFSSSIFFLLRIASKFARLLMAVSILKTVLEGSAMMTCNSCLYLSGISITVIMLGNMVRRTLEGAHKGPQFVE